LILPAGYRYASVYAGIRKKRLDDLALITSDRTASAAAVFTRNKVQAAPVVLSRKHLELSGGRARAVMVNAGNANCATRTGGKVAEATTKAAAKLLGVPVRQVLPSSTGVIGVELPSELIIEALPKLIAGLSPDRFVDVARAIMTTDLVPKTAFAEVQLEGGRVRIAGMTKGSGMIQPNMATTLGYIMTDAGVSPADCKRLLTAAADASYNRISVDGDTSTNDTLVLMANHASGVALGERDFELFQEVLTKVSQSLAAQIARDGEGASKLVTIDVRGARSDEDAVKIARAIANSPLVKTAIAGADPNWGRVISAAGYSGGEFDPGKVDILMQGLLVCSGGLASSFSEGDLKKLLRRKDVSIDFRIKGNGSGRARFWTCDFTEGYIRINGSYRT
jgi:glutamate N-acetyltransferase/amino-acid N-acetyltransferase